MSWHNEIIEIIVRCWWCSNDFVLFWWHSCQWYRKNWWILKKDQYKQILKNHAIFSGTRILGKNFVFQQDNYPKHTFKPYAGYLEQLAEEGTAKLLEWLAQSPDLNPTKLLWKKLDRVTKISTILEYSYVDKTPR